MFVLILGPVSETTQEDGTNDTNTILTFFTQCRFGYAARRLGTSMQAQSAQFLHGWRRFMLSFLINLPWRENASF